MKIKKIGLKRERLKMERNYSMIMKQLQMAYMQVTMKDVEDNTNQCIYCWSTGCGCENKATVKEDSFINLTEKEIHYA
jgi:hypothetical protein